MLSFHQIETESRAAVEAAWGNGTEGLAASAAARRHWAAAGRLLALAAIPTLLEGERVVPGAATGPQWFPAYRPGPGGDIPVTRFGCSVTLTVGEITPAVGGRLTVAVPGRRPVTASTRNWVGRTRLALAARRVGCPRALTPAARWVWRAFDALDYFLSKPEPGF